MSNEELAERITRLEQTMIQLRDIISEGIGTADADSATITGILMAFANTPQVQHHVMQSLENRMSSNLAQSLNQPAFNAFDDRRRQLMEVIETTDG